MTKPDERRQQKLGTLYRRQSDVLALLGGADAWQPFVSPTGTLLWRIPSASDPDEVYTVHVGRGADSCSCPYAEHTRLEGASGACKHLQALRVYLRVVRAYRGHAAAIEKQRVERRAATQPSGSPAPRAG